MLALMVKNLTTNRPYMCHGVPQGSSILGLLNLICLHLQYGTKLILYSLVMIHFLLIVLVLFTLILLLNIS